MQSVDWRDQWQFGKTLLKSRGKEMVQSFTDTIILLPGGKWRVWYSRYSWVEGKKFTFGYADFSPEFECLHDTTLKLVEKTQLCGLNILGIPLHWNPIQPVWIKLPDGSERIYFWAHGAEGICRFFAADSSDGINFYVADWHRPCIYHPNDRAVTQQTLKRGQLTLLYDHPGRLQPDPSEPEAPADMLMNDATNVYLLPDGTFELYSADIMPLPEDAPEPRQQHDDFIRFIQRRTSVDGLHWSPPQRILIRDEQDPCDLQFYYLSVTHTPQGRIGILGYYRSDAGTMEMELCTSQDGIVWQRTRTPAMFPAVRGVSQIYAPHSLILRDGRFHLFYTVCNYTHHLKLDPEAEAPDWAGWVAYASIHQKTVQEIWTQH